MTSWTSLFINFFFNSLNIHVLSSFCLVSYYSTQTSQNKVYARIGFVCTVKIMLCHLIWRKHFHGCKYLKASIFHCLFFENKRQEQMFDVVQVAYLSILEIFLQISIPIYHFTIGIPFSVSNIFVLTWKPYYQLWFELRKALKLFIFKIRNISNDCNVLLVGR